MHFLQAPQKGTFLLCLDTIIGTGRNPEKEIEYACWQHDVKENPQ
jgi:hypothetical protein